jgi:hypothetical protein
MTPDQHHDIALWCALIAELWANGRVTAAHGSAERLWIAVLLAGGDFIDDDHEVDR